MVAIELADHWDRYRPAVERWESLTRLAPPATELTSTGTLRLNAAFAEWMMGWPEGWVTDLRMSRADQLWIIGNGVVPQQPHTILEGVFRK